VVFIHGWSHGVYLTIPRVWIGALSIWTLCYWCHPWQVSRFEVHCVMFSTQSVW
jgi:hypothetical protein